MKAAAYARYSTDKQTENSIEYQLAKIRAYCAEKEITLAAVYTDEARSGTNTDRPGFRAMLSAAARREFDVVVIYDISRGSRDVGDWFTFRRAMLQLGVGVISASQPLGDLTNGNDFLVELLTVGLGQREVMETRKKSMDGVAVRARQGAFLGGTPPLGYDVRNGAYIVNEEEAQAVRTIFKMYGDGASYNAILGRLQGVVSKRGKPLCNSTVHSILKNERYVGTYTWCKREVKRFGKWAGGGASPRAVRIENAIPPIVDRATWDKVQARLADRKRNPVNGAKREYLLSGLIKCEACGGNYVGHTSMHKHGHETRYYICGNKYVKHTCSQPNINAAALEGFVSDNLKAWLESADIPAEAARIAEMVNSTVPDTKKQKAELAQVEAKINRGVKALLDDWGDVPELRAEVERLRERKHELETEIARCSAVAVQVTPEEVEKMLRASLAGWEDRRKAVIREHVQKIVAHKDGTISVHVGVHKNNCGNTQVILCTMLFKKS